MTTVTEIVAAPLRIHLPPNAQLPRMRGMLEEFCVLLDRALEPTRRFAPAENVPENAMRLAAAMHALNALDAARAVHNLSGTDYPRTLALHYRTLFEGLVKVKWMRKDPAEAVKFIESECFERYALATDRVKASKHWAEIVSDCEKAIERNPALLDIKKVQTGKNNPLNFEAVARGLRMPPLEVMAAAVGMDDEEILIDHGVPSLVPHTSILHVASFPKKKNADGTVTISTEMDANALLAYVARTATRTGAMLNEVLELFPDGKIMYDAEDVAKRLADVNKMLHDSMGL